MQTIEANIVKIETITNNNNKTKCLVELITNEEETLFIEFRHNHTILKNYKENDLVNINYKFQGSKHNNKHFNNLIALAIRLIH